MQQRHDLQDAGYGERLCPITRMVKENGQVSSPQIDKRLKAAVYMAHRLQALPLFVCRCFVPGLLLLHPGALGLNVCPKRWHCLLGGFGTRFPFCTVRRPGLCSICWPVKCSMLNFGLGAWCFQHDDLGQN